MRHILSGEVLPGLIEVYHRGAFLRGEGTDGAIAEGGGVAKVGGSRGNTLITLNTKKALTQGRTNKHRKFLNKMELNIHLLTRSLTTIFHDVYHIPHIFHDVYHIPHIFHDVYHIYYLGPSHMPHDVFIRHSK